MTQFLLILIFISAALSLLSYLYCWQDIKRGYPHILSLRQITAIMDRTRLNQWFGKPQPGYFYLLSPEHIQIVLRYRARFVRGECAADGLCAFGAWWFSGNADHTVTLYLFILLAGFCQLVNLTHSFWLMRKWQHQIQEEIENSVD